MSSSSEQRRASVTQAAHGVNRGRREREEESSSANISPLEPTSSPLSSRASGKADEFKSLLSGGKRGDSSSHQNAGWAKRMWINMVAGMNFQNTSAEREYRSLSDRDIDEEEGNGLARHKCGNPSLWCSANRKSPEAAADEDHLSNKWKGILTPLLYITGNQAHKKALDKHAVQILELQAISATGNKDFRDMARVKSFVHRVTYSSEGLIHPRSPFSQAWKVIVAITVLCSVIEAPFFATFTPMEDDGKITTFAEVVHMIYRLLVDLIFVADIYVNMRTGYHKLGAVVMDKQLIERHYTRNGFATDLIAAIPMVMFPITIAFSFSCSYNACPPQTVRYLMNYVRLLQLFKMPTAMHTLNLIQENIADQTDTLITSLATLLVFFVILTHFFTCAWFLVMVYPINFQVSTIDGKPMKDLTLMDSWLFYANYETDPSIEPCIQSFMEGKISFQETFILYLNCFYWASSANDAYTTQNTSEKFVAILAQILVENGFMAFILANIISSLEEYSRSRKQFVIYRSKIDAVNHFMRNESFPNEVKDHVREYYKYVWLPQQIDFTEANLHEELPHYLRTEVMALITRKVLLTSKFMSDYFHKPSDDLIMRTTTKGRSDRDNSTKATTTQWIRLISEKLIPRFFIAQQYVMKQGDIGTELYIIKQGKVAVEIDMADGTSKVVAEMGPGSYFGDIALLGLNTKRTASIRSITNCIIFELKQEDMQKVWELDPTLRVYMEAVAKKQFSRTKSDKEKDKEMEKEKEKEKAESKGKEAGPSGSKSDPTPQSSSDGTSFKHTESEKRYKREIEALEDEDASITQILKD